MRPWTAGVREDEYRYCRNAARPNLDNLHVLRRPAAALVAAVAMTVGSSCLFGGPPAPVIKIGVDLPLTGAEARAAVPALNGIRYYVQQHPTLDGYTIVLSESDDSTGGFPDPNRGVRQRPRLRGRPAGGGCDRSVRRQRRARRDPGGQCVPARHGEPRDEQPVPDAGRLPAGRPQPQPYRGDLQRRRPAGRERPASVGHQQLLPARADRSAPGACRGRLPRQDPAALPRGGDLRP